MAIPCPLGLGEPELGPVGSDGGLSHQLALLTNMPFLVCAGFPLLSHQLEARSARGSCTQPEDGQGPREASRYPTSRQDHTQGTI